MKTLYKCGKCSQTYNNPEDAIKCENTDIVKSPTLIWSLIPCLGMFLTFYYIFSGKAKIVRWNNAFESIWIGFNPVLTILVLLLIKIHFHL